MSLRIIWQDEALKNLDNITSFIDEQWSVTQTDVFMQRVKETEAYISGMPYMYPESRQRPSTRRAVVTKHISLFYTVKDHQIEIVSLWDTRQNPDKLNL